MFEKGRDKVYFFLSEVTMLESLRGSSYKDELQSVKTFQ